VVTLTTRVNCHITRRRVLTSGVAAMRNKTRKLIHFKSIITGRTKCCWVPDVTRRTCCDNACPTTWSWWSAVPTALCSTPGKDKKFFFPSRGPDQPWGPRSLVGGRGGAFSSSVRRTENKVGQSPSTTSEVKNAWSHISTPYVFVVWCLIKHRDNLLFPSDFMSSEAKIGKCVQLR
jgi:hypothetical protein